MLNIIQTINQEYMVGKTAFLQNNPLRHQQVLLFSIINHFYRYNVFCCSKQMLVLQMTNLLPKFEVFGLFSLNRKMMLGVIIHWQNWIMWNNSFYILQLLSQSLTYIILFKQFEGWNCRLRIWRNREKLIRSASQPCFNFCWFWSKNESKHSFFSRNKDDGVCSYLSIPPIEAHF